MWIQKLLFSKNQLKKTEIINKIVLIKLFNLLKNVKCKRLHIDFV